MGTLLAIDAGNTNVVIGAYRGAELLATWRTATDHDRTEDELAVTLDALLGQEDLSLSSMDALVLGSVVPPLTQAFTRLADRIANTLAAHRRYGGPIVVVDFGTTTNFDVVSADGDFLGGAFAPGLEVSAETLFSRASRLFAVSLTAPKDAIGKNTADCLRSGIMFGYVGLVDGLLTRILAELPGGTAKVIGTGGLASTIAPLTTNIERVDDDLTLEGLRLLWELNAA